MKHREGFSVLGDGNSPIFHVHPQTLGIHDPIDPIWLDHISSDGLVKNHQLL